MQFFFFVVLPVMVIAAAATVIIVAVNPAGRPAPLVANGTVQTVSVQVPATANRIARSAWLHQNETHSELYIARLSHPIYGRYAQAPDCCDRLPFVQPTNSPFTIRGAQDNEFPAAIIAAAAEWNGILPLFGTISQDLVTPSNAFDGVNVVALAQCDFSAAPNVLAVTIIRYSTASGEVTEWDQCFNTGEFTFGNVAVDTNVHSRKTTSRHEFGHVGGLADLSDTSCSDSLMFFSLPKDTDKGIDAESVACATNDPFSDACPTRRPRFDCAVAMWIGTAFVLACLP